MSDYTPDWIHIYSGWWHFIPPGISLVGVFALGLFTIFRRRLFPRVPRWLPILALSLSIFATLYLLFMAWGHNVCSIHAYDYAKGGVFSRASLQHFVGGRTRLDLPASSTMEAGVCMGWREYKNWFCIRGGSAELRRQALALGYKEINLKGDHTDERVPEPIDQWIRKTAFKPDLYLSRDTGGDIHGIAIDTARDLQLVTITDY